MTEAPYLCPGPPHSGMKLSPRSLSQSSPSWTCRNPCPISLASLFSVQDNLLPLSPTGSCGWTSSASLAACLNPTHPCLITPVTSSHPQHTDDSDLPPTRFFTLGLHSTSCRPIWRHLLNTASCEPLTLLICQSVSLLFEGSDHVRHVLPQDWHVCW